jgi:hypothetical protein
MIALDSWDVNRIIPSIIKLLLTLNNHHATLLKRRGEYGYEQRWHYPL